MKFKYAVVAALLLSISAFAQKDELRALKKLSEKKSEPTANDIKEFKELLNKAEPLMANATNEQKAEFHYYKGGYAFIEMAANPMMAQSFLNSAVDNFSKVIEIEKSGKKKYTKEIQEQIFPELKALLINQANELNKQQQFKLAAPLFETAYNINKKDTINLYNAAASAVNGQDYDRALKYYRELDRLRFTGKATYYTAINKKNNQVESFGNDKKLRDMLVAQGDYTQPSVERQPSLRGEVVKNIALIYIQKGEVEIAKREITNARKANPEDTSLILAEADLYLQTKDTEMYKKLVNEAISKNPNNADLFYNLGVVSAPNNIEEAKKHYTKALEIDPKYINAHINLGVLMLEGEQKIVDEMNKLGTSAKDIKRYDELKNKRDGMYKEAIKHLENAYRIDSENQYTISVLASLYQALEMDAKYKEMKVKMKE